LSKQKGAIVKTGGVRDSTKALKEESMIRRNKLTLEHIMHQRGKVEAEDRIFADLHQELRNLEKQTRPKEVIYVSRG